MSLNRYLKFFFFFLIVSCGSEDKFADKKDLTAQERIGIEKEELTVLLNEDYSRDSVKIKEFWLTTGTYVSSFYKKNNGSLFWFSDGKPLKHAIEFLSFLDSSEFYGLDSGFYYFPEIKAGLDSISKIKNFYGIAKCVALNDLLLTNAWFLSAVHLNKGLVDPVNLKVIWKVDSLENKNLGEMLMGAKDTSLIGLLHSFEPQNIEYRYLKIALRNYLLQQKFDTIRFVIPDPKKDSTACWNEMVKALLHWGYIDSVTTPRDTLILAVKKYQSDHGLDPGGIIGNFSRKSFEISSSGHFYYAALALEKWRWKKKRENTIQFHVNIPSYSLHVIRNDSIIKRHRVVTGAPTTRSPQFKAKIKWITLYPYWHVPHSISSKEIAPYLRRDSTYLRRNGYQLLGFKNEPVDYSTVKWKKLCADYFPYKVRQNGGHGNSLGIVAFHFPNKYDVYLHDTPSKRFFSKTMRAFSHGCIRLQNPVQMAEFILHQDRKWKKDEFNMDTLLAWIDKRFEQRIYLKKPIPIEIDYITVTSDSLGHIEFHPDVYEKEKDLVKLMKPGTKLSVPKVPVKKEELPKPIEKTGVLPPQYKKLILMNQHIFSA